MKCPVCKDNLLQRETLKLDMPVSICGRCNGVWLSSNDYLEWLKQQSQALLEKEVGDDIPLPPEIAEYLRCCADCGNILSRYKVLPTMNLFLDHCGHCNGVWFDKGELEILISRKLLGKINQFFTKPWQALIQEEETKAELDKLYTHKFGDSDYEKVKEVWNWLKDHPQRTMLLAYLQAEDPYKV
jgi:Zn-finger nucleic acid-binding protein